MHDPRPAVDDRDARKLIIADQVGVNYRIGLFGVHVAAMESVPVCQKTRRFSGDLAFPRLHGRWAIWRDAIGDTPENDILFVGLRPAWYRSRPLPDMQVHDIPASADPDSHFTATLSGAPLTGTSETDHFIFEGSFANSTVTDFTTSGDHRDVLDLSRSAFENWSHLLGSTHQVGSDLQIVSDDQRVITLSNVSLSSFHRENVHFI